MISVHQSGDPTASRARLLAVGNEAITVPIGELRPGDSPRDKVCLAHVQVLAAVEGPLPPVVVHRPTMRVVDGVHRLCAAELRGETTIVVQYFDGSLDDAYVLAIQANATNGLPLSMKERRAAAARIIASHADRSDRWIAQVSGLSTGTVAELRQRSSDGSGRPDKRVGRDGRARPLDTSEGRRLAGRLMRADPGRSLRDIARAAGIAPSTALDVRNRLGLGQDPVPPGRGPGSGGRAAGDRSRRKPPDPGSAVDPSPILDELRRDPSLRFSETGRSLLRWLDLHTVRPDLIGHLVQGIPAHCTGPIASLAKRNAQFWVEFSAKMTEIEASQPVAEDVREEPGGISS